MAEDTPTPAPAAESSVERAPAESKAGATESASEPPKEDKPENANGSEGKPSGKHFPRPVLGRLPSPSALPEVRVRIVGSGR